MDTKKRRVMSKSTQIRNASRQKSQPEASKRGGKKREA